MQYFVWVPPFPIKIAAREIGPVVSIDYSIGVDHWDQVYHELLFDEFKLTVCQHRVNNAIHHQRSRSLPGVLPGHENESFLLDNIPASAVERIEALSVSGLSDFDCEHL